MAQKGKANCHGWGIFGGKHKKKKNCATGIFRTPAQKRASSKRKNDEKIRTLLELLESNTCRVDNQISKDDE